MLKAWGPPDLQQNLTVFHTSSRAPDPLLFNVTILSVGALGTCCGTVPTSRWAPVPPSPAFSAAYLTKVEKNGIRSSSPYSAIHEIPYRSSGIEMGSESWKMEMRWHFHVFLLFQRGWKEPFCNLDKRVSMFAVLSSRGRSPRADSCCWLDWRRAGLWAQEEEEVEGFTALRMVQLRLEFKKASTVTARSCAGISYLMKLNESPVSGSLVRKKLLRHS